MTAIARRACVLITLLTVFGGSNLQAQTNPIYFPYVTNNSQTSTELILTNASGRDANVNLVAYRDDGEVVNEVSVSISARSQLVVGPGTFTGLTGWVLASTDVPGVVGNVRISSTSGSSAETAESAQPDTAVVLPLTSQSPDISADIAVANPNVVNTRVILTVYDANGRVIASDDSVLAPFAMRRGSLSGIFGTDKDYSTASHLVARSEKQNILSQSTSIVAFEVVRGFARIPDDPSLQKIFGRSDWAAFAAIPVSSSTNSVTFSQSLRGADWFSLFGVVNLSGNAQSATVTYATESNRAGTSASISIPANGSVRISLVDLFGAGQDSGTVRITSTGTIAAFQGIGTLAGSALGTTSGQQTGLTEFLFPLVDETTPSFTGIALYNGASTVATVDLYLISPQGVTLGHVVRLLLPQQGSSALVREFFVEGFAQRGGFVFVRSSAPVFATAVIGVPDSVLSQLAARATFPGFIPSPQTRFVIKGRITDQSTRNPVPGVGVVLSRTGASDATTATDANGEYIFRNLVPADYTVKPVQLGWMFSPFNPVVRIDTASRLVDFTREIAPAISAITVITTDSDVQRTAGNNPDAFAVFGTSEVSLKIDGSNFVGPGANQTGQTVFFGSHAIPAGNVNFMDSKTIFVKLVLDSAEILSELATQANYGRYDITIGGQTPFNESRSNAQPFYVVPPVPVLVTVVSSNGKPETFARYEVTGSGETITVTGYGFRPGAQLLFNGSTALNGIQIDTKFVTSQILQAYLPPQALRLAGLFSLRVRNQSLLPEVSGEAVIFTIFNLLPQITSVEPATIYIGPGPVTPVNLAINGTNFHANSANSVDPGTSFFIRWMPTPYVPLENVCPPIGGTKPMAPVTSTFVTSNQFMLMQLALPLPNDTGDTGAYRTGTYELIAANAGPGGGCSPIKQFNVVFGPPSGVPTIDAANPLSLATRQAGTAGFNLTVFRDLATSGLFQADAWVNFGTVRLYRTASDPTGPDTITVFVPAYLITSPGTVPITVTNPGTAGTTGGTSNRAYLLITP